MSAEAPKTAESAEPPLPPVEPPSAGFLIQLFVIPGVIVAAIVGVWLLFTSLASDSGDPRTYLEHLRSNTDKRWHAAFYLASALAGDEHTELRYDPKFMADMAEVLDQSIEAGDTNEQGVAFRSFLCRALGHFHIAESLPTLVRAATTQRDPNEVEVRLSALEAIAQLTDNIRGPLADKLLPQAAALARKSAAAIRSSESSQAGRTADRLSALADEADALAKVARRSADLGRRSARLADEFGPLVDAAQTLAAGDTDRDRVDELRTTVAEIARQSRETAAVDWQPSSPLAEAVLKAADERTEQQREDPRLKRSVRYDYLLRERGAFALGVLGGQVAIERLNDLLSDAHPNVRYNAATSLCRQGAASPKLAAALVEMISDPQTQIEEPKNGFNEATRKNIETNARQQISANALRATLLLYEQNPDAELAPVIAAIERLAEDGEPQRLRIDARTALDELTDGA
jgi:hypothetical protein